MTTAEKLYLIDEYLENGHIEPKWEEMIQEYRKLILMKAAENTTQKERMETS